MAEVEGAEGVEVCERCGKVRPVGAASTCTCGGKGRGEPAVPEGWDPELTRTSRPRLSIVRKAEQAE